MFGKKDNLLGLDIGSQSVKVVQIDAKSSPPVLLSLGLVPLPVDAFLEGRISKADLVAKSIQQLAGHLKIKDRFVAASISGYEVMTKQVDLPMMTEEELESRMQAELGQYIPYNIEEVDVDYQIMDVSKDRANQMEVLLVAAKKESINDYVNLIKLAGLQALVIDVDYFALSNAFEATYGLSDDSIVLVDIGANKAIMNVVARGIPLSTRSISIGGAQITDLIHERFKIPYEEAERIKLGETPGGVAVAEVEEIFVSVVKNWVRELKRAIDFYYSNFPDNRIAKMYLSGGSCRIPELDKVIQDNINIDVDIFNPLTRVEYDSKVFDSAYVDYIGPQMAISLGLALRKAKGK